jgi:hypothetical protein
MFTQEQAREELRKITWEEGKSVVLLQGPYRHEIVLTCSSDGRKMGVFADGERHKYFCCVRLIGAIGTWHGEGGVVVSALSTSQLLMVIEQRSPLGAFPNRPMILRLRSGDVDLRKFGPYSSVEFPGGSVEVGADLKGDYLHELHEETGAEGAGVVYRKRVPHYQFVSDVAARDYLAVVYLEGMRYTPKTSNDGGLVVMALWPDEILCNIRNGTIASAHAALLPFAFYREIEEARKAGTIDHLLSENYVETGSIRIDLS